ncbi:MAG TPA: hypothetical protein VEH29_05610 [Acidimicrobiales bacterium]|nr:hypothetical protein [Acidimicrobiales bacterium]
MRRNAAGASGGGSSAMLDAHLDAHQAIEPASLSNERSFVDQALKLLPVDAQSTCLGRGEDTP